MKVRTPGWLSFALALFVSVGLPAAGQAAAQPTSSALDAWQQQLQTWRAERAHLVDAPNGWLSLTAMEWLKPGVTTIGSASDNRIHLRAGAPDHLGLLTVSGSTVQLLAPSAGFPHDLTIGGKPAREGPLPTESGQPEVIAWHDIALRVLNRGTRYVVEIKDAESPARQSFRGLYWYPPDPNYRVTARWIPYTPARVEKIPTILGTSLDMPTPGVAEFTLNGQTLQLEPVLEDPAGKTLFFILRDATSTTTTYPAARYLHTGLPDHGLSQPGQLILDFNRLENPPSAYTPYAVGPLPPAQNRLSIAIEAGERRYHP